MKLMKFLLSLYNPTFFVGIFILLTVVIAILLFAGLFAAADSASYILIYVIIIALALGYGTTIIRDRNQTPILASDVITRQQMTGTTKSGFIGYLKGITSRRKKTLIDLAILCTPALVIVISWFRGGMVIAGQESGLLWFDSERWFSIVQHAWTDINGIGASHTRSLGGFMIHAEGYVLDLITSPVFKQMIFYFSTMAFDAIFMYLLVRKLYTGKYSREIGLLAGLFYTLNSFQLMSWNRNVLMFFALPALPLFLYLYLRGIESKKHTLLNVFLLCAAFSIFTFAITIIPLLIPAVIAIFGVSYILFNRNKPAIKNFLKFNLILIPAMILTLNWYLFPIYTSTVINQFSTENMITLGINPHTPGLLQTNDSEFRYVSQHYQTMIDSIRLVGFSHAMIPLYPIYASGALDLDPSHITNPIDPPSSFNGVAPTLGPIGVIGFVLPILAFSAIFVKEYRKITLPAAVLSVIGIVISNGSNPPFGDMILWLYNNFPFFVTLRTMFEKVGSIISLGYALLIPVSLVALYRYRPNTKILTKFFSKVDKRILSLAIIFLILGPYVYPLWTGSVFQHPWIKNSPYYVKVPDYYYEANEWLETQPDEFSIMVLPLVPGDGGPHRWEQGYDGASPYSTLFDKPTIAAFGASIYDKRTYSIMKSYHDNEYRDGISSLADALNVKYIVLNRDIDLGAPNYPPDMMSVDAVLQAITNKAQLFDISNNSSLLFRTNGKLESQLSISGNSSSSGILEREFRVVGMKNFEFTSTPIIKEGDYLSFNWNSTLPVALTLKLLYNSDGVNKEKITYNSTNSLEDDVNINLFKLFGVELNQNTTITGMDFHLVGQPDAHFAFKTSDILIGQKQYYGVPIETDKLVHEQTWLNPLRPYTLQQNSAELVENRPISVYEGYPTLEIKEVYQPKGFFGFKLHNIIPANLDYTESSFLHFWLKISTPGVLFLDLSDKNGNHCAYDGRSDLRFPIGVEEWTEFSLPVKCKSNSQFDSLAISTILIATLNVNEESQQTIEFGGLKMINPQLVEDVSLQAVKKFGNLEVLEVKGYEDNRVYVSDRPRIFNTNEDLLKYLNRAEFDLHNQVMFVAAPLEGPSFGRAEVALTKDDELFLRSLGGLSKPEISFTKISPAEYHVHVENSGGKFLLVLNDTYDPLWKLFFSDNDEKAVLRQFPANVMSNAWVIDKPGSFDIRISYEPETTLHNSAIVTAISFTILSVIVVFAERRNLIGKIKRNLTLTNSHL